MKHLLSVLVSALAIGVATLAGAQGVQPSTPPSTPLFDGKTFTGWDGDTEHTWRIVDGAMVGGSLETRVPRNEFVATTAEFSNFVLRLQFKLLGTEGFVNSGVQIRSQRIPNDNEMIGYQVDIGDPAWWGSIYDESRRNRVLAQATKDIVGPIIKRGDWNQYVIHAEGPRVRAYINGLLTIDYTEPDASLVQKGRIGFQVHGGGKTEVWFRDIHIQELP